MPRTELADCPSTPEPRLALVGCYTTNGEPGLRSVRLHADGAVEPLHALAMESPSCVVWHPSLPVAYAANETLSGGVTAVDVDETGAMRAIGTAPTGSAPCHLAVTPDGRWLVSADYLAGTVTLVPLATDGRPRATVDTLRMEGSGPHVERQEAPHPHMIAAGVVDGRLLCVDLGTDLLTALRITDGGQLSAERTWRLPAGTGPRQVVAHPSGEGALVVGELSATLLHVVLGDGDDAKVLAEVPTTASLASSYPAQIAVAPDGKHVVVSTRGPDTLTTFDSATPALSRVAEEPSGARWPRHFLIAGDLVLVSGEQSSAIEIHAFDAAGRVGRRLSRYETAAPTWIALRP